MSNRLAIIGGGLIAALIAVGVVEGLSSLTEGIFAGRLITMVIAIVSTGILYALIYALTNGSKGELQGFAAGVIAGALGAIFAWAIGEAIAGPFEVTGLLVVALIGGLIGSSQIDPVSNI